MLPLARLLEFTFKVHHTGDPNNRRHNEQKASNQMSCNILESNSLVRGCMFTIKKSVFLNALTILCAMSEATVQPIKMTAVQSREKMRRRITVVRRNCSLEILKYLSATRPRVTTPSTF